ncbi:HCO3- transporter family [Fragilaria crotonensis]|nr:HCO3- transporter family [Fragilaria crotonensis]
MINKALLLALALLAAQRVAAFTAPTSTLSRSLVAHTIRRRATCSTSTRLLMSDAVAVSPEAEPENEKEPLFEGLGRGILRDYRKRLPLFKSDITDGLNVQSLAATLFLFFACLAPAVGFGGLYAAATNGAIGTMEMVSSTAGCGILYALFSAQPMTIIGSTGPVLAFVATLAQLADKMNLPFLPLYSWTGLWTAAILFVSSLTSSSNLVKYLTRFTDEIFSVLISAIFVVEAVSDVGSTFINPASTFTKALLTFVLASFTYFTATTLKGLRNTVYFNKRIRDTISNFAPTIGVVTACTLARWARVVHGSGVAGLPSLALPITFATTSGRPWLVPLLDLPVWARWASLVPALMATVLLFLDQNITVRLVNNPQYKMKKGRREGNVVDGMHADMLVISLLTAFQSLFGIPWLVAATSLSCFDGALYVLGNIIPPGNEMWERILGLFQDPSIAPKSRWTDTVPKKTTNIFTFVQIACLAAMFYVKESSFGVLFPIVIALMAPLRFALERSGLIKKEYIEILDED